MSTKEISVHNLNSAGTSMADLKQLAEGLSFDGVYTLEHWIRDDEAGSFFAARSDEGERLMVKLAPDVGAESDQRLAVWQRSRHLRHANLLDLRDSGRVEIQGTSYIYAVFENPEDVLASAIAAGPLDEQETRSVVESAISALRYLHGQGLVHSAVDPNHIVAVGDAVKLTTDVLREFDVLEDHAEDVRQLGELIRTLRAPEQPGEPLAQIAMHATEADPRDRWTLAEIVRVLERAPAVKPAPAVVEPVREPTPMAVVPVEPPVPPPAPSPSAPPLPAPAIRRREPEAATPGRFPRWIFAGVAIVLFAILAMNIRRKPEAAQAPSASPQPLQRVAPTPIRPVEPAHNESARAAETKPSPLEPASTGRAMWRVIAFTYTSHDMAAKKAKQVNERWPDLHAGVFAPKDRQGYYLVALGGRMRRDDAAKLQRKARGLGLPRDTYVQNYSE
jgi:eukaryotic-like serine/threonine-protein kinase